MRSSGENISRKARHCPFGRQGGLDPVLRGQSPDRRKAPAYRIRLFRGFRVRGGETPRAGTPGVPLGGRGRIQVFKAAADKIHRFLLPPGAFAGAVLSKEKNRNAVKNFSA